ncbi:MAG: helix-turn-helix protein [Sediminibacterium sp.]|nr:helix-turn-helix protein [Sediminibacterium sp.]
MKKLVFVVTPTVQLLDLAGPVQVFTEAKFQGLEVAIEFCSYHDDVTSAAGLGFAKVVNFSAVELKEGDIVFVPGMDYLYVRSIPFRAERPFFNWLKQCADKRIIVCSICNGAFALGEAGLLNNIECTTHWRRVGELQKRFPLARVVADILFVKTNNVYTSAGISAGIDLALSILEDMKGALFTHKIARGLVVYHRRSQKHTQDSIYLDYRNHINPQVHTVQDHLIDNIGADNNIEMLAELVSMSPRNLSRVFKEKTGTTILEYLTQLRIEYANTLLNNPEYTMDYIAAQCGFKTARQLQRILK